MSHRFYKYKLLLDEGIPPRVNFPRLNSRYDIKHIAVDLHKSGLRDIEVYRLAVSQKRVIVTFNDKDFKEYVLMSEETGVIGVSTNLSTEQMDKKLISLLVRSKKSGVLGRFNYLSGETA